MYTCIPPGQLISYKYGAQVEKKSIYMDPCKSNPHCSNVKCDSMVPFMKGDRAVCVGIYTFLQKEI